MQQETLGKHRRAELSCLQRQSAFVSCCLEKKSGKGVNMVSSVTVSAVLPSLAYSIGLEHVMKGRVSWFGLSGMNVGV